VFEDLCPVRWAGRQAAVTLLEYVDLSNAGQIGEELLAVINGGATALIADMIATIWCDHAGAGAVWSPFTRPGKRPWPPVRQRRRAPGWPARPGREPAARPSFTGPDG
jgi:hypothetical protein